MICAAVPSSTTCTFWLVPSQFKLISRKRRDYLAGSLAYSHALATLHLLRGLSI